MLLFVFILGIYECIIIIRIPRELKEKIRRYSHVNWSEVVREAIVRRIKIEERLEAIRVLDDIRRRVKSVEKGIVMASGF